MPRKSKMEAEDVVDDADVGDEDASPKQRRSSKREKPPVSIPVARDITSAPDIDIFDGSGILSPQEDPEPIQQLLRRDNLQMKSQIDDEELLDALCCAEVYADFFSIGPLKRYLTNILATRVSLARKGRTEIISTYRGGPVQSMRPEQGFQDPMR